MSFVVVKVVPIELAMNGNAASKAKAKAIAGTKNKNRKFFPGHKTLPVRLLKKFLLPVSFVTVTIVMAVSYLPLGLEDSSSPLAQWLFVLAQKCTTLSYALPAGSERVVPGAAPGTTVYDRGLDDLYFITFTFFALNVIRGVTSTLVFRPLALMVGVKPKLAGGKVIGDETGKFVEQCWTFLYYISFFCWGSKLLTTWEFDLQADFRLGSALPAPHELKLYYLIQSAFWLHMFPVTLTEPWRGDFVAMMSHHCITCSMVGASYYLGVMRIGTAVFVNQDAADVLLPLAKMFKYAGSNSGADIIFGLFTLVWIPTRHGIFFVIVYALWTVDQALPSSNCLYPQGPNGVAICACESRIAIDNFCNYRSTERDFIQTRLGCLHRGRLSLGIPGCLCPAADPDGVLDKGPGHCRPESPREWQYR